MTPFPITAYTIANALGATTREVLEALWQGRSGLASLSGLPFPAAGGTLAGELEPLPAALSAFDTRQTRIAHRLFESLEPEIDRLKRRWRAERIGLVLGTSTGGLEHTERAFGIFRATGSLPPDFDWDRTHAPHGILDVARRRTGVCGPGFVVATACSSSAKVFGAAQRLLATEVCDAVIVGGIDTLCQTTLYGFHALSVLSPRACRPFALGRDGISIGEGGALLVLERTGEGPALLLGVGETQDAHHMTAPHPAGLGARAAMEEALAQAGARASEVDHVHAHATGTPQNDAAEAKAIRDLLGPEVPVLATKGYTGHLLGAAGATQAVFSIAAIERGELPASVGSEVLDPALGIAVVQGRRRRTNRLVLSNSFAFGGNNACLALGAPRA